MSMTKPGQDNVRYEVITQEDPDTGDLIMPIPPQLLEKMGWKEGTTLHLEVTEEGTLIITDKSLTNTENSV